MIGTHLRTGLTALLIAIGGCTYNGKLDENFYTPASHTELASKKIPLSAAVVYGHTLKTMRFYASNGGHAVDIPVGEPLKDAVLSELSGIFEKTGTVDSLEDQSYDVYVVPTIEWSEIYANSRNGRMLFTAKFEGTVHSRDSKAKLGTYSGEKTLHYYPPAGAFGAQVLTGASLGLLAPITVPATTEAVGSKAKDMIGQTITDFVQNFGKELAKSKAINKYAEMKQELASGTHVETAAAATTAVAYKPPKSKYDDFLDSVVTIRTPQGAGSGFFIDGNGLLVTNRHVVGREKSVSVRLRDGSVFLGTVVARSAAHDLALVRIANGSRTHLRLSPGGQAGIGNDVLAIGTPVGLDWSVSRGIVSALRIRHGTRVVQTDATINHGNSGGPLIDLGTGLVVGVNTYAVVEGDSVGLNFAVASEEVLATFPEHLKPSLR